MKRLSIIIVTYKSEKDIFDCLQSVWKYNDIAKEELEVIVVDNSPECEPMFGQLRSLYGDDIILIHNTHNGGYGHGNNMGIRRAIAPVVMIMNPDVRLIEPVFHTAIKAFEKETDLCMYGMKQMLSKKIKSHLSFDSCSQMNGYVRAFLIPLCNRLDIYLPKWMYFAGACFFVNKEKFLQAGLFDEDIFMYGEEDDIHWRMSRLFGNHFTYNSRLHYLHLTLGRPLTLSTELTMLNSFIHITEKRGISANRIIRNILRYTCIIYYQGLLRRLFNQSYDNQSQTLKSFISELKKQLKQ